MIKNHKIFFLKKRENLSKNKNKQKIDYLSKKKNYKKNNYIKQKSYQDRYVLYLKPKKINKNKKAIILNRFILIIGTLIVGLSIFYVLFRTAMTESNEIYVTYFNSIVSKVNNFISQTEFSPSNHHFIIKLNNFINYKLEIKNSTLYMTFLKKGIKVKKKLEYSNYVYIPNSFYDSNKINIYQQGVFILITDKLHCNTSDKICDPGCIIEKKCDPACISTIKDGICDPYCSEITKKGGICDPDCVDNKKDGFYDPNCYTLGICDPDSDNIKDGICNEACAKLNGICDPDCLNDPDCNKICNLKRGDNCLNNPSNCKCEQGYTCKANCLPLSNKLNKYGCINKNQLGKEGDSCQSSCQCSSGLLCDKTEHCCPQDTYFLNGKCTPIHHNGICDIDEDENCKSYPTECPKQWDNAVCCINDPNANIEGYLRIDNLYKNNDSCYCNDECQSNNCAININNPNENSDKHCCPADEVWNGTNCTLNICGPGTSICQKEGYWPNHKGFEFYLNEHVKSCDTFEVCRPDLIHFAKEAIDCCYIKNPHPHSINSNTVSLCSLARSKAGITDTEENIRDKNKAKTCAAYYIAYGETNIYYHTFKGMTQYYWPETESFGLSNGFSVCQLNNGESENPNFNCNKTIKSNGRVTYYPGFNGVKCQERTSEFPEEWANDTVLSKDTCYGPSARPAHVDLNIVHTGICSDYSIALTTLLRMVGYTSNEVYTVLGVGHAYNMIKLPGHNKFIFFDTVGGQIPEVSPNSGWYNHCKNTKILEDYIKNHPNFPIRYNCINDEKEIMCPINEIQGCS